MNKKILKTLIVTLVSLIFALPVKAVNITWDGDTDTNFNNGNNWVGGTAPANNVTTDIGIFPAALTTYQPSLTASRSISGLVFQATSGGWVLGCSSYTLTVGSGGIDASANTSGTNTINANISIGVAQTWAVGAGGNLLVNGITKVTTGSFNFTNTTGTLTLSSLDADNSTRTFNKYGDGTLVITGAAGTTLQGVVSLRAGVTVLGNKSALGTTMLLNGGILQASTDLSGANAMATSWTLGGAAGTISGGNNITLSGNFTGMGGSYTLTSSLESGKTLVLSGGIGISSGAVNYNLGLAGTGNTIISGVISNGGTATACGFTISNTGTTTVNNANTYAGTTTLNAGTLILGNKSALGTGTFAYSAGTVQANTDLSGVNKLANTFTCTVNPGLNISGSNNIEISGDYSYNRNASSTILTNSIAGGNTLTLNNLNLNGASATTGYTLTLAGSGNTTIAGTIADGNTYTNSLTIDNAGLTILSGNNTYRGKTTVSAGTVRLNNANAVPGGIGSTGGTSNLTVSGGAVIELAVDNFFRGAGTGATNVNLSGAGGGGFSAYGANRIVNLGGATGQVTWNSGSFITLGSPLVLNSASADHQVEFQNPISLVSAVRTIQVNDNPNSSSDQALISGVITSSSASGGLVKTGTGTLILSATNTFTGPTTVSNGVLLIHGVTTNSAITVVAGGTLGGTGNVGLVSVNAGGAITANGTNTIGTLTATNLTVAENSIIYWNYDATTADLINVTGALTLPTNATVYVSGTGALPSSRPMFSLSSGSIGGPATLKWTITGPGIKATTHAVNYGTHVSLVTSSGTIITLQ